MAVYGVSLGKVVPGLGKAGTSAGAYKILDLVFRDCALILEQSSLITTKIALNIPLPLIGFAFKTPESITLARYRYASFPYLNKAAVANSFIKETCPFEVEALRPITADNPVVTNYAINMLYIKKFLISYADKGGLFGLNTMWGYYGNLALTELKCVRLHDGDIVVQGFRFSFERLNFANIGGADAAVSKLASVLGG